MSNQYKQLLKLRRQTELRKTLQANQRLEELRAVEAEEQPAKTTADTFSPEHVQRSLEAPPANTGLMADHQRTEKSADEIHHLNQQQLIRQQTLQQSNTPTAAQNDAWPDTKRQRTDASQGARKYQHVTAEFSESVHKQNMQNDELQNDKVQSSKATNSG